MKNILSILLVSVILFSCSNGDKRYHIDETTFLTDTLTFLKLDMTQLLKKLRIQPYISKI